MALPTTGLARAVIGGQIGGDTWTCGLWFDCTTLPTFPSAPQMNTWCNSVQTQFNTTLWASGTSTLRGMNTSAVTVASVKGYFYASGALIQQGQSTGAAVAGTGTVAHPAYVALCCTLGTPLAGRSNRGRIYLPATAWPIDATTLQAVTNLPGTVSALAGFITGCNGLTLAGGTPKASVVSSTHGYLSPISFVRADSIPDTQHGRSNKFVAVTSSQAAV